MCKVLNISRATLYYKPKGRKTDSKMETAVIKSFKESKKNYGTRKIKDDLNDLKIVASRRKIGQVMKAFNNIQGKLSDVDIFHTDRGQNSK